jgi:hypothetical protein
MAVIEYFTCVQFAVFFFKYRQTDCVAHPASCPVGTGGLSPRMWQGPKADHSPPYSAEVKNGGAIPPLPNMYRQLYLYICSVTLAQHTNLSESAVS